MKAVNRGDERCCLSSHTATGSVFINVLSGETRICVKLLKLLFHLILLYFQLTSNGAGMLVPHAPVTAQGCVTRPSQTSSALGWCGNGSDTLGLPLAPFPAREGEITVCHPPLLGKRRH